MHRLIFITLSHTHIIYSILINRRMGDFSQQGLIPTHENDTTVTGGLHLGASWTTCN